MFHPGQNIASYTLLRRIGAGGAAEVWSAQQAALGVRVAIKLLVRGGPSLQTRLHREGQAQRALSHPNLLSVRDLVELGDGLALVLPLVEGPSLAALLDRRRLSPDEGIALMRAVVEGVAQAHAQGFVHRDLKPSNVLLDPQPTGLVPRVADFGLVKVQGDRGLTREGALLGTLQYAAPEQLLDAAAADARADLFSLGVMLFELLTGAPPFDAASLGELLAAHRRPLALGAVPEGLRPLLTRLLSPDPAQRPADGAALALWLRALDPWPGARPLGADGPLFAAARAWWREQEALPVQPAERRLTLAWSAAPVEGTLELRHRLPAERDPFFGREEELSALGGLFAQGARCVTVVGTAGAGKTRLVQRHGWRVRERYPGGAWFCDLAEAREVFGICAPVAAALGVPLDRTDPVTQLAQAILGRGRCLVILDNVEQVVNPAADTVGQWLAAAPEAVFLITSRQRLELRGEQVLDLAPLDPVSAVELFVARAQAVRRGFAPDEAALDEIGELVALLDHLPLAIELAAARARLLLPAQLLARIGDRFQLLRAGGGRPSRHATLRAALDWSWALLEPWEQAALAQLSVFEGGCSVEAAEAVLELGAGRWPLEAVQSLVDKSLVAVEGDGRLRMLVSVQEYARARLIDAGTAAAARAELRHGAWFRERGRPSARAGLSGPGGGAAWRALAADLDNLLAATRRAVDRGDGETSCLAALAAWAVVERRGPASTGMQTLAFVLPLAGPHAGEVRLALGRACVLAGQAEEAAGHHAAAEAHFEAAGELGGAARARVAQASIWRVARDPRARPALEAALAVHRDRGEAADEAAVLAELGRLRPPFAEVGEAQAWLRRALALVQALGDSRNEALVLDYLGQLDAAASRFPEAIAQMEHARALHLAAGNRSALAVLLGNLGFQHLLGGDRARAREMFHEALVLQRLTGRRPSMAFTHMHLGNLYLQAGELDAALRHHEAALAITVETRGGRRVGYALGNLAAVLMEQGRLEEAGARLDEAEAILEAAGPASALGELMLVRAQLAARAGRHEDARAALRRAEAGIERADGLPWGQLLATKAEVDRLEGHLDASAAAVAALGALVEQLRLGPGSWLGAELARATAALAPSRGR